MALRTHLTKQRRSIITASTKPPPSINRSATRFEERQYKVSSGYIGRGIFRRFLPPRATNQAAASTTSLSAAKFPEFLTLPSGEKLREALREMTMVGERNQIQLGEFDTSVARAGGIAGEMTVEDVRRIVRVSVVERLKARLRAVGSDTVSYGEFVRICVDGSESEAQGLEFAKLLDESGNVIVFGNVVLLRPDQVVKSMETLLSQSIVKPGDPRRKQLEELERQKAQIDNQAQLLVRRELYCGLGLLAAQTLGFMRLTFWELSWDVMEPICFFATSLHFGLAYAFFLRTSTEPSFEGFFRRRFEAKQKKLMKLYNFDVDKYDRLCKVFYPNRCFST